MSQKKIWDNILKLIQPIIKLIQLILKLKFKSLLLRAFSIFIGAEIAINGYFDWYIKKNNEGFEWGVSDSNIGLYQCLVSLFLLIAFIVLACFLYKIDLRKVNENPSLTEVKDTVHEAVIEAASSQEVKDTVHGAVIEASLEQEKRIEDTFRRVLEENVAKRLDQMNAAFQNAIKDEPKPIKQVDALNRIYEALIKELSVIDKYTLFILNRGGLDWYSGYSFELPKAICDLNYEVDNDRTIIDEKLYTSLSTHIEQAVKLYNWFNNLVMAICEVSDQEAFTDVVNITYDQDIEVNADFVDYMMNELMKVSNHYAFEGYSAIYREQNTTGLELLVNIKSLVNK